VYFLKTTLSFSNNSSLEKMIISNCETDFYILGNHRDSAIVTLCLYLKGRTKSHPFMYKGW